MSRKKALGLGGRFEALHVLFAQKVEAAAGCKVMNVMTSLGMPASRKIV